jgi:hypothetical protein
MSILQLIAADSFIAVNKRLIKEFGLHEALLLGAFASKQNYNNNDWFYYTQEAITNDTTLSRYNIESALKHLIELEIIITKKEGLPAKKYYLITDKLGELLLQTSMSPSLKHESNLVSNIIYTNNTKNNNIPLYPLKGEMVKNDILEKGKSIYPEREHDNDIVEAAYKNWLMIINDKQMKFTNRELKVLKDYVEAKPYLRVHTIKTQLMQLNKWARDGLDICGSLLASVETKILVKATLEVLHDKNGNRIYHQAIAKKRLQQIELEQQENKQKIGVIGGFSGYSGDCIDDLVCM